MVAVTTTMKQPQNNFLLAGLQAQSLLDQVFKNNGSDPGTLDPHRAEGVPASNVLRDLYEGLVSEKQTETIYLGLRSPDNIR